MIQNYPFTPSKSSILYSKLQEEADKNTFLESLFAKYKLSASHIIKYKKCPKSFLYECFLKVKYPPNTAMLKGIIVHSLLDWVFKFHKETKEYPTSKQLSSQFDTEKEKEELKHKVFISEDETEILKDLVLSYFEIEKEDWNTIAITEFYVFKHIWNNIPLTGFIDKIEFKGRNVTLVDYKTGNVKNALTKFQKGNDYWFQLVFYAVLMEEFKPNWNVESIEMCLISDVFESRKQIVSEEDKAKVKEEVVSVYDKISSFNFEGCKTEHCYWCSEFEE